jgi:hypothetical protein
MKIQTHPILFSTEMVKAILENRKSMTRRVVKPQPYQEGWAGLIPTYQFGEYSHGHKLHGQFRQRELIEVSPYQVGDRLWVRETFCYKADPVTAVISENEFWYKSTNPEVIKIDDDGSHAFRKDGWSASPWLPSIHMPRKASRITLEITNIRVERLQEIAIEDIQDEGFPLIDEYAHTEHDLRCWFHQLWDSINAKRGYSWESNPWVWCISFKRI